MVTTQDMRNNWAPACTGPWASVALYGDGKITVRASIVEAVKALSSCLEHWGYKTRRDDTGAQNCRKITGGTGYSLHAYGIAIDINWNSNQYGKTLRTDMPMDMVNAITSIKTNNGKTIWRWGGSYNVNKDAMHYEVICTPKDLSSGVDWKTVASLAAKPTPPPVAVLATNVFKIGDNGKSVAAIQLSLNNLTEFLALGDKKNILVDEDYGKQTFARVAEFQTAVRGFQPKDAIPLPVTGAVDRETLDLMAFWGAAADVWKAIKFAQGMLNILTPYAKLGSLQQIPITGRSDAATIARTVEFQTWARSMQGLAGAKPEELLVIDGNPISTGTLSAIGFWVKAALK